jgi:adenosine deaminase
VGSSVGEVPTLEVIRQAPTVLLHDHLDGGLRPATVVELARAAGYAELPETDPKALAEWFTGQAWSGSLERYLEPFSHTVAVMQTAGALERVAAEAAEDLRADGVVYAEVRFAPELHADQGLTLDAVVEAVVRGFASVDGIRVRALVTAMRHAARSVEIAELALRWRDRGVVGFDIAGAEAGFPPTRHLDAFQLLQRDSAHFTIHAGEAFGLPSIWEALQWCNADRLGHGVRIMDDIEFDPATGRATLGRLAAYVRDTRVPLEMCPTSNVQTGAAPSVAEHPIGVLRKLRFRVTVNTDNRLMSGVTLSEELAACAEAFGWTWDDLRRLTLNAAKSAFEPFDARVALMQDVIKPWFSEVCAGG